MSSDRVRNINVGAEEEKKEEEKKGLCGAMSLTANAVELGNLARKDNQHTLLMLARPPNNYLREHRHIEIILLFEISCHPGYQLKQAGKHD